MPLTPELQFQKALLLLDRGEGDCGEALLREVASTALLAGDIVLATQARCCLGELLIELDRPDEAKPLLESVVTAQIPSDMDDLLDMEVARASELLEILARNPALPD